MGGKSTVWSDHRFCRIDRLPPFVARYICYYASISKADYLLNRYFSHLQKFIIRPVRAQEMFYTGMVPGIISHDLRALTRRIFSNFGIGLSATIFPARSIKKA